MTNAIPLSFQFNTCQSIINKTGAVEDIGEVCRQLGISHPIIVTDEGIKNLGLLQELETSLTSAKIASVSFTEVVADPPESVIEGALEVAGKNKIDGVIGFGGGSSLDTAKLVALLSMSGESLADIYGVDKTKGPRLPLILIPTTAGTGSEVTPVAIVTTGETTKLGVVSSVLYPDVALLDAKLTIRLPATITAMTGVDAMVHAIEAYTSVQKKNAYSDMLAREALRLMSQYIKTATHDGENLYARQAMLLGSCLAGQAFANAPVGGVHALAYPLGGHYHIPHGLSNSLVLPHVLRFNAKAAAQQYAELAAIVLDRKSLLASEASRCDQFISYLIELIAELELPNKLSDVKVKQSDLPVLAADAMLQQRLLVNNPREITETEALEIYRAAY